MNKLAKGHDFFDLDFSGMQVSPDNGTMAYSVDTLGRRNYEIVFVDISTGNEIGKRIEMTDGSAVWANDSRTVFYIKNDPVTLLGDRVYRHQVGQNPQNDTLVYQEDDKTYYMGIGKTKSGKYIIIGQQSTLSNDYHILDANEPDGEFKRFTKRLKKHRYLSLIHI